MQWFGKGSENIEDRRGMSGGGGGLKIGGGIGILVVIIGLFFGQDLTGLIGSMPSGQDLQSEGKRGIPTDPEGKFVSGILESTDSIWITQFSNLGLEYERPTVTIFKGSVPSACGNATASVGPFYCPGDHKIYIDLSFYDDLKNRFNAAGDFAQAYVIAHEVGHHVQNLLGVTNKMEEARQTLSKTEYNRLSVNLELQADFYAGLWANKAQNLSLFRLEAGDIEEALTAANAIGDDTLQKQAGSDVVPDSFTHGTSAQRIYWFKKGFETGDFKQGDTFNSNR